MRTDSNPTANERYRIAISDGGQWCAAMLATQLNELHRSGQVQTGAILRLQEHLVNHLNGRK